MKRFMGALTMAMLSFCLCADGVFTVTQYNLKTCIETLDGIEYAIYRPGSRVERQATKTYSQLAFVSGDVQSQGEPHFYGSMVHIPLSRGSSGCFAVKVDGIITIPESGYWTFAFGSDDGFRAEISGHGVLEKSSSVDLRTFETTLHKVLFENPGKYNFRLIWFTRGYDNAPGDLAGLEVSIAQGSYSSFNASAFKLLKASSEGLSYEVRFDANGGYDYNEMNAQIYEESKEQKLSKNTYHKEGYVFQGWATNSIDRANSGIVDFVDEQEITVDSDMTLYAVWANPALPPPTGATAVTAGDDPQAVVISWDAVSEATSYKVEYSFDNQTFNKLPNVDSVTQTTICFEWNLPNATWEIPRYYRVIAQNDAWTSEPSASATWQYSATAFPSAVHAKSFNHSSGTLTIAWDNASNPLTAGLWYSVYRKTSAANAVWEKMCDTQSQEWMDEGFSAATRDGSVCYKVQTGNGIYLESNVCETGRKFGVFVGVDTYENNWCEAREHCVAAAEGLYNRHGGNCYLFRNAQATDNALTDAFSACSANARPGDSFVYLHVSHGIKENGVYIGSALYAKNATFSPSELSAALNNFREGVSIAVILDTCFSGLMPSKVTLTHSGDVGWITSTSGDFVSFSSKAKSFASTGIVTSGWGYGCADKDGDGYVTLLELGRYAELWSESAQDLENADPDVKDNGGVLAHMYGGAVGGATCPLLGADLTVSTVSTQTGIELSWSVVAGSSNYYVYKKVGDAALTSLSSIQVTISGGKYIYNDTSVETGKTYTYYIKPYNDAFVGRAVSSLPLRHMPQNIDDYLDSYWDRTTTIGLQSGPFDGEGKIDTEKLNDDHDGDGYSTYQEFVAGTDPRDPNDRLTARIRLKGTSCEITCEPNLGTSRKYTIMGKRTLERTRGDDWTDVTKMSDEERNEYKFFKVGVEMP